MSICSPWFCHNQSESGWLVVESRERGVKSAVRQLPCKVHVLEYIGLFLTESPILSFSPPSVQLQARGAELGLYQGQPTQ